MTSRDYENTVNVVVLDTEPIDSDDFPLEGTLDLLIEKLTAIREGIPEEYRKNASFEIGSDPGYEGSTHATISIGYFRPMTPEERDEQDRSRARSAAWKRATELAEFSRLSQKLGYGDLAGRPVDTR